MLEHLNIKNLVVVEELNIQFKFGMTVITGETGAGKSILVQALNIVSGGRSDASLVRMAWLRQKSQLLLIYFQT